MVSLPLKKEGRPLCRAFLASAMALALSMACAHAAPSPSSGSPSERLYLSDPDSPYAAATAGQFAAACEKDQASCVGRIGNVLMSRILGSGSSHICLPGISYANAVAPWLNAHPEDANMSADDGISLALTTIYKCGPPNNY